MLSMGHEGAPPLRDLIVDRNPHESIRQHAHIRLTEGEYRRAVEALRAAGAKEDGFYKA